MESTDRTLLRLHVEAVWDVRLPSFVLNDVELLPDGSQPSWNLCAADQASGRVYIWRHGVTTMERETLRLQISKALALPPHGAGVHVLKYSHDMMTADFGKVPAINFLLF